MAVGCFRGWISTHCRQLHKRKGAHHDLLKNQSVAYAMGPRRRPPLSATLPGAPQRVHHDFLALPGASWKNDYFLTFVPPGSRYKHTHHFPFYFDCAFFCWQAFKTMLTFLTLGSVDSCPFPSPQAQEFPEPQNSTKSLPLRGFSQKCKK